MLLNSIIVKSGIATVYGALAHKVYNAKEFPRERQGNNIAFVREVCADGSIRHVCAQTLITNAANYLQPGRVLIVIED